MTRPSTHYVTYFDRHYLTRGVALLRSLRYHSPEAVFWIVALDDETERVLAALDLGDVRLISLSAVERADPELRAARRTRSLLEYYYTLTAPALLYVLSSVPSTDRLVYLDADTFFFGDPAPMFDRYQESSILLLDHRYPPDLVGEYKFGRYNVGLIVFYPSPVRQACLELWRKQCVSWCYDRVEGDRYGDQRYLDSWPELFPGTTVSLDIGVGLAPWNLASHAFTVRDGELLVDGEPTIHFHFSSTRRISARFYDSGVHRYRCKLDDVTKRHLYLPYVTALAEAERLIKDTSGVSILRDSIRRKRYERFGDLGQASAVIGLFAAMRRGNLLVVR